MPNPAAIKLPAIHTITVDPTAAGNGWFVDPTPAESSEFFHRAGPTVRAVAGSAAAGRMDLVTVIAHELGHVLGRDDLAHGEGTLMGSHLDAGQRYLAVGSDAAPRPSVFAAMAAGVSVPDSGDDPGRRGRPSAADAASADEVTATPSETQAPEPATAEPTAAEQSTDATTSEPEAATEPAAAEPTSSEPVATEPAPPTRRRRHRCRPSPSRSPSRRRPTPRPPPRR